MDFQSLFYALGSFFLILGIAVMIALLVLAWKAFQVVKETQAQIVDLKENLVSRVTTFVSSKPSLIASSVGAGISSLILKKVRDVFNKR